MTTVEGILTGQVAYRGSLAAVQAGLPAPGLQRAWHRMAAAPGDRQIRPNYPGPFPAKTPRQETRPPTLRHLPVSGVQAIGQAREIALPDGPLGHAAGARLELDLRRRQC